MFLSEWHEFPSAPRFAGKKTSWQLASRCCWNRERPWHASELVSFLVGLRTYQQPGTYSMEQSRSWEANRFSASQEIPRGLWKPKVHYHIYKCPYPEPLQSSPCPTSHNLKSHLNIILPTKTGSSKWPLSLRFLHQNAICKSPPP